MGFWCNWCTENFRGRCSRLKLAARDLRKKWQVQLNYISASDIRIFPRLCCKDFISTIENTARASNSSGYNRPANVSWTQNWCWRDIKFDLIKNRVRKG